jgi:hypothetical protein
VTAGLNVVSSPGGLQGLLGGKAIDARAIIAFGGLDVQALLALDGPTENPRTE